MAKRKGKTLLQVLQKHEKGGGHRSSDAYAEYEKDDATRDLMAALIAIAHDRSVGEHIQSIAFAAIKRAKAAGIQTWEQDDDN